MEEDRDILEAGAADVDQADPQFVEAEPEHLLDQDRDQDLLGIALDEHHALGKEQVAANRVEIALDVTDLSGSGRRPGSVGELGC